MMTDTDKEILELCAKAMGIEIVKDSKTLTEIFGTGSVKLVQ